MLQEKKYLIFELISFAFTAVVFAFLIWLFPYARNYIGGSQGSVLVGGTVDFIMFICYAFGVVGFAGLSMVFTILRLKLDVNGWYDFVILIFNLAFVFADIAFVILTFTLK